jgi:hypothetical protein
MPRHFFSKFFLNFNLLQNNQIFQMSLSRLNYHTIESFLLNCGIILKIRKLSKDKHMSDNLDKFSSFLIENSCQTQLLNYNSSSERFFVV